MEVNEAMIPRQQIAGNEMRTVFQLATVINIAESEHSDPAIGRSQKKSHSSTKPFTPNRAPIDVGKKKTYT